MTRSNHHSSLRIPHFPIRLIQREERSGIIAVIHAGLRRLCRLARRDRIQPEFARQR